MADFKGSRGVWRRSTKSGAVNCVEVAVDDGSVLVRDSGNPDGVVLRLPTAAWSAFLAWTRGEDFRLP